MSLSTLFKDIENAEHSTCVWFEHEFVKLHKDLPEITAIVDKILPYVSLLLQTVLDGAGQVAAGSVAANVLNKAQSALDVANAVVYDTGVTPTAVSAISAVASNLKGILSTAQISNTKSVATITKAVSELGTLTTALSNSLATPVVPAAT